MNSRIKGNTILLTAGLACFGSALIVHRSFEPPLLNLSKQESAININATFLRLASVGNKRMISDLFWIATLIESDLEHYKQGDEGSWMYHRFNTIAQLDPRFYQNYLYGGQYLSIVKDDIEGASRIYLQGLKVYPDDYDLNFNGGFHFYFEAGDDAQGLRLLETIIDHPKATVALPSIVHKLKVEAGADLESIFQLVLDRFKTTQDESLKSKLASDLYAIRAEIDLECLNSGAAQCSQTDLEGQRYRRNPDGSYTAAREFQPYRLKRKREANRPPSDANEN